MQLKPANHRVVAALRELDIECDIRILDHETRTSAEAAETLGCQVAQIAKSLIFKAKSERAILAITSGSNRVVLSTLAKVVGEKVGKADADFVRQTTGFAIGGVAPVGLASVVETVFDEDLFLHETVWAAAGTANSLFPINNADLRRLAADRIFAFGESLN